MLHQLQFFDKIRIDHFRAFESYYAVPYGATTAKIGRWVKGVGTKIFDGLDLDGRIIAEDLGIITDKVRHLVKRTGFPGMKVFQFAFDGKSDNEHLPENVRYNTVYYTGTHDNDTLKGWYDAQGDGTKEYVKKPLAQPTRTSLIKFSKGNALPREIRHRAYAGLSVAGLGGENEYPGDERRELEIRPAEKLRKGEKPHKKVRQEQMFR